MELPSYWKDEAMPEWLGKERQMREATSTKQEPGVLIKGHEGFRGHQVYGKPLKLLKLGRVWSDDIFEALPSTYNRRDFTASMELTKKTSRKSWQCVGKDRKAAEGDERGARNRPLGENEVLLRVAEILTEKARPFNITHSISCTDAPSVDWLLLGSVLAPNQWSISRHKSSMKKVDAGASEDEKVLWKLSSASPNERAPS